MPFLQIFLYYCSDHSHKLSVSERHLLHILSVLNFMLYGISQNACYLVDYLVSSSHHPHRWGNCEAKSQEFCYHTSCYLCLRCLFPKYLFLNYSFWERGRYSSCLPATRLIPELLRVFLPCCLLSDTCSALAVSWP